MAKRLGKIMPNRVRGDFTLGRVLMCEGDEDVAFFEQLIAKRRLPNFHMRITRTKDDSRGGKSKFGAALEALKIARGFESIRHIVIVSDNDTDKISSFEKICNQVRKAGFAPPDAPNSISIKEPNVTIIMVPFDRNDGDLECLCVEAAKTSDRRGAADTDNAMSTISKSNFSQQREDKLWLRINLSIRSSDPFIALFSVFKQSKNNILIPLDHKSFDFLSEILEKFRAASPSTSKSSRNAILPPSKKAVRRRSGTLPRQDRLSSK